ncbi:formate/nitrite transporter family protein [Bradyrhizobium cenepequi]
MGLFSDIFGSAHLKSVTDKIVALMLPTSAFTAAGFEHCVANKYFLPLAWLLTRSRRLARWSHSRRQ